MAIPIIDIFAGPGGLGEGFSALKNNEGENIFKIALSIEKDPLAHLTLTLRSFYRQFNNNDLPQDYYELLKGNIDAKELYSRWPEQAAHAHAEAWCGTLGDPDEKDANAVSDEQVDAKIRSVLAGRNDWLLIGGPPCQAYSIVGRSRRKEKILNEDTDKRVGLYKQYLRILAKHSPAVFVMENVKGILSAETSHDRIFSRILQDLSDPQGYYPALDGDVICPGYRIYSLVAPPERLDEKGRPVYKPGKFVIQAEKYGIPQTRHRVILLGVRNDIDIQPSVLQEHEEVPIKSVIGKLPRLRSGLSKRQDSYQAWKSLLEELSQKVSLGVTSPIDLTISETLKKISDTPYGKGKDYLRTENQEIDYKSDWYLDDRLEGVVNHASRSHMDSDIHRYLFVSSFGKAKQHSPKLSDFPHNLLPAHNNVKEGIDDKKFADRFRVQLEGKASKTITSHISKDGHYYIHPDPSQCRSLSVREAARIQTFPDNYFFCGPRTSQFHQVGNAVPPLLAYQIAGSVGEIFRQAGIQQLAEL
ncbi:DNA (cytosine-5-)-methyltransferase [Pedobacter aquatilis]|uniref:DNA cytosine methyltransferase n=1 Tax=Pedobacter aquatilis TaxID=351343 RepID=UPI00292E2067|nr:DNA (cytosine-5-)-methyltransferase [Pedobacter aquatilis]